MSAKVAFVGLGVMGFPMAGHLKAKGYAVGRNAPYAGGFTTRTDAGDIEARAVKEFGSTDDIGSMGYVLRDEPVT